MAFFSSQTSAVLLSAGCISMVRPLQSVYFSRGGNSSCNHMTCKLSDFQFLNNSIIFCYGPSGLHFLECFRRCVDYILYLENTQALLRGLRDHSWQYFICPAQSDSSVLTKDMVLLRPSNAGVLLS